MIDWGVACGPVSEVYLDLFLTSLEQTTDDLSQLRMLLGQNSTTQRLLLDIVVQRHPKIRCEVVETGVTDSQGSYSHGLTLDRLLDRMTGEIGIVSDVDIAMLKPGWDRWLSDELVERTVVGVTYPNSIANRARKIPCAFWMAFRPERLQSLHFTFQPRFPRSKRYDRTQLLKSPDRFTLPNLKMIDYGLYRVEESDLARFPANSVNDLIVLDTGQQLYMSALGYGLQYATYDLAPESPFQTGSVDTFATNDGELLLTHFRKARGRCQYRWKNRRCLIWLDRHVIRWWKQVGDRLGLKIGPPSELKLEREKYTAG